MLHWAGVQAWLADTVGGPDGCINSFPASLRGTCSARTFATHTTDTQTPGQDVSDILAAALLAISANGRELYKF